MKAMVFAAGLGTRLRPLTDLTPKSMLKVGEKPIIHHLLDLVKKHGVDKCAMNLHYLPEPLKKYCGDGSRFGLEIKYLEEKELSGTAGAVKQLENFFYEPFFVIYGDNLTDINLSNLFNYHNKRGGLVTIALYHEEHPESKGIVLMDDKEKITMFKEKPKTEEIVSNWANAGIYVCQPEVLKWIPKSQVFDFGRDLFPLLLEEGQTMYGYRMIDEYLLDIGTHDSFARAQKDIKRLMV